MINVYVYVFGLELYIDAQLMFHIYKKFMCNILCKRNFLMSENS